MNKKLKFTIAPLQRWLLLLCALILGYVIASVVSVLLLGKGMTASRVCIVTIIQDITVFILPALVTAVFATRRPADLLSIKAAPFSGICLACVALVASIPFMDMVIDWNAGVTFPEGVASLMRSMEESASAMVKTLVNGNSVMSLVVMVLVVGCFAGFSEELFFRGAVQRLLITGRMNPHLAIWLTAVVFSAFHLQFYGFVPRLLLGAMFGYVAWWLGSIWPSVAVHVLNNSIAAFAMWRADRMGLSEEAELYDVWQVVVSFVITAVALGFVCYIGKRYKRQATHS